MQHKNIIKFLPAKPFDQLDKSEQAFMLAVAVIDKDLIETDIPVDKIARRRSHENRDPGIRARLPKGFDHRGRQNNITDAVGADNENIFVIVHHLEE